VTVKSILPSRELIILWRLAARSEPLGPFAGDLEVSFGVDRPVALDMMRRMAVVDIAKFQLTGEVTKEELLVLLQSDIARVRELGLRLARGIS
jgi:hypothetical protein